MKLSEKILLSIVIIVAFIFRIYKIDSVPPGLNRDEASLGYNAYSILKTGNDEYGRFLPLSFQSFGDWKLPLYVYLSIPFISFSGLSEMSIRMLSVISGTATVFILYFLVKQLFEKNENMKYLPIISAMILAISPWHIHFSRIAYESNVALLLVSLGLLLFLMSKRYPMLLIPSSLAFALTYYTYHGNHIFTTIFIVGLIGLFHKQLNSNKHKWISLGIYLLLTIIIFSVTVSQADMTKLSGIGIFGNPTVVHEQLELPRLDHQDPQSIITRLMHNKYLYTVETVLKNYLMGLSFDFLFIKGGTNHAHNIPGFGNLYLIEAPYLLVGLAVLFQLSKKKSARLIIFWILVSPLTASITKDAPHTARTESILPALAITIAIGIWWVLSHFKKHLYLMTVLTILICFYFINISIYLDRYYVHFPIIENQYWGIKYKTLTSKLKNIQNYKTIIIPKPEESPYIFLLFYSQYNPIKFQNEAVRYPQTKDGFLHIASYGNFQFRDIDWSNDSQTPNTLIFDSLNSNPQFLQSRLNIKIFTLPNDLKLYYFY